MMACQSAPLAPFELITSEVSGTDPALSPNGRFVVFSLLGDLWRVPREGGTAVALTEGPAYDSRPAFFPDGRLVFQSDRSGNEDLWLLDELGATPRQLTSDPADDGWPAVSPDGAWVVFTSDRAGTSDVWRLPSSGGPPQRLTFLPGDETQPAYRPDGLWIVFTLEDRETADVFELPARGGSARRVFEEGAHRTGGVPTPAGELLYFEHVARAREAKLRSTSGTHRLERLDLDRFARWRPAPTEHGWIFYEGGKLWELDGADVHPVEFLAQVRMEQPSAVRPKGSAHLPQIDSAPILDPDVSPDGDRLVYSAGGDLWIHDIDKGESRRLTAGDFFDRHPSFSPDGQQIAYVSEGHLRLVLAAGGPSRRLTPGHGELSAPRWLPGGEGLIAARRDADQRYSVVEVPLEGIGAIRLAGSERTWYPAPTVAPGGAEAAFHSPQPGYGSLATVARPPAAPVQDLRLLLPRPVRSARLSPGGEHVLLIDHDRLTVAESPQHGAPITAEERIVLEGPVQGARWATKPSTVVAVRDDAIVTVNVETGDVRRFVPERPRPSASDENRWALSAARIWTGHSMIENGVLVMSGGRIERVGRRSEIADLPVIDLGNHTLLPGLIDLHVHLAAPTDLPALALAGVTTVRDVGGELATRQVFQWLAEQNGAAPRILSCGELLEGEPAVFGNLSAIARTREAAAAQVARLSEAKAWGIKIYPSLGRELAASAIRLASERGLRSTAHVTGPRRFFEMVLAGSSGIEHGPSEPIFGDLAALAAAADVVVTPTIVAVEGAMAGAPGEAIAGKLEGVRALHRAGVRLGAGTDSGLPPIQAGPSLHDEIVLLARATDNTTALAAATTTAAEALGLESELGALREGMKADLLVVEGNPLEDITAIRQVRWVVRDGRIQIRPEG